MHWVEVAIQNVRGFLPPFASPEDRVLDVKLPTRRTRRSWGADLQLLLRRRAGRRCALRLGAERGATSKAALSFVGRTG